MKQAQFLRLLFISILLNLVFQVFFLNNLYTPLQNNQLPCADLIHHHAHQSSVTEEEVYSPMMQELKGFKEPTRRRRMNCDGFPEWPLPPGKMLYDDHAWRPKCNQQMNRWVLHQTSKPKRRPSVEEVKATLSSLPSGTGFEWHSDDDICDFMRTQPLRFQALFNTLIKTTHKVDLWRYLLLYQRGGIYLDDDAQLLVDFNETFVDSVDSACVTQGNSRKSMGMDRGADKAFGFTVYNGFLISKPCNDVLLDVAEQMLQLGSVQAPLKKDLARFRREKHWENNVQHSFLLDWYNLKLLASAVAERAPNKLHSDVQCKKGPTKCTFFGQHNNNHKFSFSATIKSSEKQQHSVIVYKGDQNWTTAVFDVPQCGMPVKQTEGGKHGHAKANDPHPSPWFPASKSNTIKWS